MPRGLLLLLLLTLFLVGCSVKEVVRVGDEPVVIERFQQGNGKTFIHLHQNETTALQAAKAVMHTEGGQVITLRHSGQRNVVFHQNGHRYEFDPNRIFSDAGIRKTLTLFGPYSKSAHAEVKKLADKIKAVLPKGKVIAVHNNRDYSIKEYLPGNQLHRDAGDLHLDPAHFYRNFYLVTQRGDFVRLKRQSQNIVLQSKHPTDDGSLSVFLARHEYVNVEAAYGQLMAQIKMLRQA